MGEIVLGAYHNKICLANWSDKKKSDRTNNRLKKGLDAKQKLLSLEKRVVK